MEKSNSYVYFALKGDDFNPKEVTKKIGINPTISWKKGDKGVYNPKMKFSCWQLETEKGTEPILIDNLVTEIVNQLINKVEIINELKKTLELNSVLEIVMDIDTNEEQSTPALGHDLRTIEFLFATKTITDLDIYRYNSKEDSQNEK